MQERGTTASLRLLSLKKACLLSWPSVGMCEPRFQEGSHSSLVRMVHCINCANIMVYDEHLLSFWESEILVCASRGCLCDKAPVKILGTKFLMSFPGGEHFIPVATTHCWRNEA